MSPAQSLISSAAIVSPGAHLEAEVRVWPFAQVLAGARVGAGSVVGHGCFVGENVVIGERCRLQSHVSLFEGVILAEEVFVGPHVTFTNVKTPRAFLSRRDEFAETRVGRGASIGANATILPGLTIGEFAMVGAGAVVTKSVHPHELVVGSPARRIGWVSRGGRTLIPGDIATGRDDSGILVCPETGERYRLDESGLALLS